MVRSWRQDTHGSSATLSFALAGMLLLGAVSAVVLASEDQGQLRVSDPTVTATQQLRAADLLHAFTTTPGSTSSGVPWDHEEADSFQGGNQADDLARLGLLEKDGDRIAFEKLKNLARLESAPTMDGRANYDEIRDAMGLDDAGLGFHIRIKPALKSVEELLASSERQEDIRLTYIGEVSGGTYTAAALREISLLDNMIEDFCPFAYDDIGTSLSINTANGDHGTRCTAPQPGAHAGSVLPADKDILPGPIAPRLGGIGSPTYDYVTHLVIGSEVNHIEFQPSAVKDTIESWVDGGGTLIIFAGSGNSYNWMNSGFKLKMPDSEDPVTSSDSGHSLLTSPNSLGWDQYEHEGAWQEGNGGGAVTLDSAVSTDAGSLVGISDSSVTSAAGDGTVIVTAWTPYDLVPGEESDTEAMGLVQNLVSYGYRDLYLDYGEIVPAGRAVSAGETRGLVYHPELEMDVVLSITVYLFDSA